MSFPSSLRMSVKLFADRPVEVDESELVRIFHRWIQDQTLSDQLMVDVADYSHVPSGPGVVLVCHAGHYSFDGSNGRTGLRYEWKRGAEGVDSFSAALCALSNACLLLEKEDAFEGKLHFDTGRILLRVNDRLNAPNTAETAAAVRAQVEPTLDRLFAGADAVDFEHLGAPEEPFELEIRVAGGPSLETLCRSGA